MEVSIFKNVRSTSTPFNKDVMFCLDRIKNGNSKDTVLKISKSKDKKERDTLKLKLPGVCYNGIFKTRSKDGLIKKSGLIVLDFDGFDTKQDAEVFKESIIDNEYVFSCWLSPSYIGVKVLVKIPVDDNDIKFYFSALSLEFECENWDNSGSDVSRFCYESYDPNIYVNTNSKTWTKCDKPEVEDLGTDEPSIAIKSDNRIIENLLKWWEGKYGFNKDSRNNNLFKLAIAFNDFGVSRGEAESILYGYEQSDFKQKEIDNIIKSAYKKSHQFGTKFFEDKQAKSKIEKQVRAGKKTKDIIEANTEFDKVEVKKCVENIKETIAIKDFFYYDKNGNIKLSPHSFKFWLEQNNFFKYFPANSNTYSFIKREQNLLEETTKDRIKDFVLEDLLSRDDIGYAPYDFMALSSKYFTNDFLTLLDSTDVDIKKDTREICYLYYKNCVVEVTKKGRRTIDYLDIEGSVWKRQIIDRDYIDFDHHTSVFRRFIWLIAGQDVARYNSFKSVIGYLLHSYKTGANSLAVVLNDETISENPDGRSGKGLFSNALGKMKKMSVIDGKTFDTGKSFPYQTVSTDTQILLFDDVKKNFNFEILFSLITEGITLEYKGQDAVKIPVEDSPKVLITTNYTIGGVGGSFEARKFELELSSYFNHNHTPVKEFGHMFFDEWDEAEWSRYDNFMINCCQYYMENGLIKHDFKNLPIRKFIKNTSFEFYEWTKDKENLPFNVRHSKKDFFNNFIEEYQDFKKWLSQKKFKQWLEEYAKFYGYKYLEGNSNGQRWFEIENDKVTIDDDNDGDIPF